MPATKQYAAGRPATARRNARAESALHSWASTDAVRHRMQQQRTRDTAPELAIRRLLHARGLRYRIDVAPLENLRRRADIVFRPAKVAVFVDGCFWHGCPQDGGHTTHANSAYWSAKIARNQLRDRDTDGRLAAAGWLPIRVWEHEPPEEAAARIAGIVLARRKPSQRLRARGLGDGTACGPLDDLD